MGHALYSLVSSIPIRDQVGTKPETGGEKYDNQAYTKRVGVHRCRGRFAFFLELCLAVLWLDDDHRLDCHGNFRSLLRLRLGAHVAGM